MCLVDVRVKTFRVIQTGLIVGEKRRPKFSCKNL